MSRKLLTLTIFLLLSIAAAACAPAATPTTAPKPTDAMMEKTPDTMAPKPTDAMMEKTPDTMAPKPTDAMMEKTPDTMAPKPTDAMMEDTAWFKLPLTDVRSGEKFTMADFKGKVVLVEDMATWCPNCLQQQKNVQAMLKAQGMMDDLVVVGIGVDLKEDAALLKSFVEKNGFDWKYAVATPEVAKEISTLYGAQFLNPSSTPMMIIDRSGKVFPLPFGIKSAESLAQALAPHLAMK